MSSSLPPPPIQEAIIDDIYNNQLLSLFLMGIYTVVYLGTLYTYASKKSSKNWFVAGSISLSYLVYVAATSVQWHFSKMAFVNNGTSREAVFIAVYLNPQWEIIFADTCLFIVNILGDGLLIWRCFNVWDRSWRAILLPLSLLLCEIGIDLSEIIINVSAPNLTPSESQDHVLNILIGASLFVTFATTLVTTILIAYRIHSVSKQDILQGSRSRFKHILEILVQSAAVYSVAMLASAILMVIPATADNQTILIAVQAYTDDISSFIAGVAPTLMVARVALAADDNRDMVTISRISGLQFRSTPPNATAFGEGESTFSNGDQQAPKDSEQKQGSVLHIA